MKLNPLQQKIITYLEPLPTGLQDQAAVGMIERGKLRLSEAVTGVWRSLRRNTSVVWDPWILKDDDVYRLFYLRGPAGQTPWWTVSHICGAVSADMRQWQDLGSILEPNLANDWESGRICAGCTYKEDGVYYLFYSAGGTKTHLRNEAIGLATSVDGVHFSRHHQCLLQPDDHDPWYGRSNWTGHFHWRDPYIFKDHQTGKYYMFICASSKTPGNFQGCVGLAVADKISGPYELRSPVLSTPIDTADNWPYYHVERPQVIYKHGLYHLFFSCFKQFFNPKWLQQTKQRITNSSLYWYISDKIEGPYQPISQDAFVVKGSEKTGMYGTNFLQVSTEPEELIAYGWYHRLYALAVSQTFHIRWQNPSPGPLPNLDTLEITLAHSKTASQSHR